MWGLGAALPFVLSCSPLALLSNLYLLWSLPDLQHWSDNQYQVPSWPMASPFCILSVACGNKDGSSFASTVSNLGRIEKGAKIYFGSSFKGFSPLVAWPCPPQTCAASNHHGKGVQGGTKFCGSQEAKRACFCMATPSQKSTKLRVHQWINP